MVSLVDIPEEYLTSVLCLYEIKTPELPIKGAVMVRVLSSKDIGEAFHYRMIRECRTLVKFWGKTIPSYNWRLVSFISENGKTYF